MLTVFPPALMPLEAELVLISSFAPSIFRWPEPGSTIPYPNAPAPFSLIVTFVFAPEIVIFPFIYRSPKVPFPLFSRVTCAPSEIFKFPPSNSTPPSFPFCEQFLTTKVPPLMLVVLPFIRA